MRRPRSNNAGDAARAPLERALGHRFRNEALIAQALTHRSFGSPHNERLEFLGDGVLDCVIAEELYRRFPDLGEGPLSRLRASLVREAALAAVARELGLSAWLRLGEGEAASGGAANGAERRRVKELERELRRKDRALAEAAALLVLSKKLSAIFQEDAEE